MTRKPRIDNYLAGAFNAYKSAGKGMTSADVSPALSAAGKTELLAHSAHLRTLAPLVRGMILKLGDAGSPGSIEALRLTLASSVKQWRQRNPQQVAANIKPGGTSKARHQLAEGKLEPRKSRRPRPRPPTSARTAPRPTPATASTSPWAARPCSTPISACPARSRSPGPAPTTRAWPPSTAAASAPAGSPPSPPASMCRTMACCCTISTAAATPTRCPRSAKPLRRGEYRGLTRTTDTQLILSRGQERHETYERVGERFHLVHIVMRNGAGAMLHYEHSHNGRPVLSDINTYADNDPSKVHLQLGTLLDDTAISRACGRWSTASRCASCAPTTTTTRAT
jgi:hypothetical protein